MTMTTTTTIRVLRIEGNTAQIVTVTRELADFQRLVGGDIEGMMLTDELSAYINEDGKQLGLPANPYGDIIVRAELAKSGRRLMPGDVIVGPLVLVGAPNWEGWDTDVPDEAVGYARALGLTIFQTDTP